MQIKPRQFPGKSINVPAFERHADIRHDLTNQRNESVVLAIDEQATCLSVHGGTPFIRMLNVVGPTIPDLR